MKNVGAIFVGILLFLAFLVLSYQVKHTVFNQLDFDTTVRLQNHLPKRFDQPLSIFSLLGSIEITTLALLGILIGCRRLSGVIPFMLYGLGSVIEIFGKTLIPHPGPPFFLLRYNLGFFFPSFYLQTGFSYPSGHAFRTSFLTMVIMILVIRSKKFTPFFKLGLILCLIGITFLMALSRVSLGEHWTSDVVAGLLLGISFGLLSWPVFHTKNRA